MYSLRACSFVCWLFFFFCYLPSFLGPILSISVGVLCVIILLVISDRWRFKHVKIILCVLIERIAFSISIFFEVEVLFELNIKSWLHFFFSLLYFFQLVGWNNAVLFILSSFSRFLFHFVLVFLIVFKRGRVQLLMLKLNLENLN